MTDRSSLIDDVKPLAQARVLDVLAALGVRERPRGQSGYISMCNPVETDKHPSFTIWTRGAAAGAFKDHRDDRPGGTRGDIIDLVAYLKGWFHGPGKGRKEALHWLADFLGVRRMTPQEAAAAAAKARKRRAIAEKQADASTARNQRRAAALWLNALEAFSATLTPVDTYLVSRGIDLARLPHGPRGGRRLPNIIRSLPEHQHTESGRSFPCMIAACIDYSGFADASSSADPSSSGRVSPLASPTQKGIRDGSAKITSAKIKAVHRTWLRHDGLGKADVTPVKKVWPSYAGLVIPLWRGDTGMTVGEAIANGVRETLVLTEGIEDGLSAVVAAPQFRTWAFIALSNLGNVVLPECIDSVIVHRQNEWENHMAVTSFNAGKAALEAQGRPVTEVRAAYGKDLNDTLRMD